MYTILNKPGAIFFQKWGDEGSQGWGRMTLRMSLNFWVQFCCPVLRKNNNPSGAFFCHNYKANRKDVSSQKVLHYAHASN